MSGSRIRTWQKEDATVWGQCKFCMRFLFRRTWQEHLKRTANHPLAHNAEALIEGTGYCTDCEKTMLHSYLKPEDLNDTDVFDAIVVISGPDRARITNDILNVSPELSLRSELKGSILLRGATLRKLRLIQEIPGVASVGPNRAITVA